MATKPGWNYLNNSPKWHYFTESNRSLCGKWAIFGDNADSQDDNDDSADNCAECRRRLKKLRSALPKPAAPAAEQARDTVECRKCHAIIKAENATYHGSWEMLCTSCFNEVMGKPAAPDGKGEGK